MDKGSCMRAYERSLRVKWELGPSDGGHHTLACAAVDPPKSGNLVLRRGKTALHQR